jgi:lipoyl(octanoyl) transferase
VSGSIALVELGRRRYGEVLELQRGLCRARVAGELQQDVLLLVEHEPVVTLGRATRDASLPVPMAALATRGFEIFEVERGGDVTLHAPGQLVGYPILDLSGWRRDLHWYLRRLEQVLIATLDPLGIPAERVPGKTGVWTREGGRKIASIGIHVKQWVTMHGFALNVSTDLALFDLIVPCGIPGVQMTSVVEEVGREPGVAWAATRDALREAFGAVFQRTIELRPWPLAPVS